MVWQFAQVPVTLAEDIPGIIRAKERNTTQIAAIANLFDSFFSNLLGNIIYLPSTVEGNAMIKGRSFFVLYLSIFFDCLYRAENMKSI